MELNKKDNIPLPLNEKTHILFSSENTSLLGQVTVIPIHFSRKHRYHFKILHIIKHFKAVI